MKNLIYILLIFTCMPALAQTGPALQYANLPYPGEKVSFYKADINDFNNIYPGSHGANQHWDFSNLVYNTGPIYMSYDSMPKDTPGNIYPKATARAYNTPMQVILSPYNHFYGWSSGDYEYYWADGTGFYNLGGTGYFSDSSAYINTINTPPQLLIRLPFSLGDSASGKYMLTGPRLPDYYPGAYQYKADAYGSLRVPGSVYDSVIRVHTIETTEDSQPYPQATIYFSYYIEKYSWYNLAYHGQGFAMPVLELGHINFNVNDAPFNGYIQDYILFSDKPDSSPPSPIPPPTPISGYKGYYNNMLNSLIIQAGAETGNAEWQITDIVGRRLNGGAITLLPGAPTRISCAGIAQGLYIFTLNHNNLKFIIP